MANMRAFSDGGTCLCNLVHGCLLLLAVVRRGTPALTREPREGVHWSYDKPSPYAYSDYSYYPAGTAPEEAQDEHCRAISPLTNTVLRAIDWHKERAQTASLWEGAPVPPAVGSSILESILNYSRIVAEHVMDLRRSVCTEASPKALL